MERSLNLADFDLIGLNIGCGKNFERDYADKGFLYVDVENCDGDVVLDEANALLVRTHNGFYYLRCDLTESLPFRPGSVQVVLLEHVVEHLDPAAALLLLRRVRAVLADGGCARVSVPDLAIYIAAYQREDHAFFEAHGRNVCEPVVDCWEEFVGGHAPDAAPFLPHPLRRDTVSAFLSRPAVSLNQIFRFWGHRWMYDFAELSLLLRSAGFGQAAVSRRAFGDGHNPRLARMDRSFRKDESLYVEALK